MKLFGFSTNFDNISQKDPNEFAKLAGDLSTLVAEAAQMFEARAQDSQSPLLTQQLTEAAAKFGSYLFINIF